MLRRMTLMFLLIFIGTSLSYAQPAQLWKTGQTTCYDTAGTGIPCTGTGQDGEIQAGVAWPSPRFTDNGDGTVTDNLTGLIWLKDANCIVTQYPGIDTDGTAGNGSVTWQHALDFVTGVNAGTYSNCGAGYTDWRLPNRKELRSLVDYSQFSPALPLGYGSYFINVSGWYWSSTTLAGNTDYAWNVRIYGGGHVVADQKTSGSYYYVWPVRAGFLDNSVIPMPTSQQGWSYAPVATLSLSSDPASAKPTGVGSVATGGDILSIRAGVHKFASSVDIYFLLYVPNIDPYNIYLVTQSGSIQLLSAGLVPWKAGTTGPVNESLFGDIPVAGLTSGTYYLGVLAAPAGSNPVSGPYYLWITYFVVP